MSLEARDISFRYPCGHELYRGLSLSVEPGERVALTAPSGRGKTTLCQLLAGYLEPASGCVLADGEPVRPIARLRGEASPVQLLPQHPELAFDPRVRLGRSLGEVAGAGEARARADELLGSFGVREEWLARHTFYKHIGLYAFRTDVLRAVTDLPQSALEKAESLEQLRWLENGYKIGVGISEVETVGIDTPEDLEKAERFLQLKMNN